MASSVTILVMLCILSLAVCVPSVRCTAAPRRPPPTFHMEFFATPIPDSLTEAHPIPPSLQPGASATVSSGTSEGVVPAVGLGGWKRTKAPNGTDYLCYVPGLDDVLAAEANRAVSDDLRGRRKFGQVPADVVSLVSQQMGHEAACASKTVEWWTYEACWNAQVRQFHVANNGVVEKEFFLGKGPSHDVEDGTKREDLVYHEDPTYGPYLSTVFLNGTECDLTGLPRQTEIRLHCANGAPQRGADAFQVSEPRTCHYLVLWWSTHACIPLLRKETGVDLAIACYEVNSEP